MTSFSQKSRFEYPVADLFAWHKRPGALERLTPPWERVRILERQGGIHDGGRVRLQVKVGPFWREFVSWHDDYEENRRFRDVAVRSPFRSWTHVHTFNEVEGGSELEDAIEYELPKGYGFLVAGMVRRKTDRGFAYRHETTKNDLARHAAFAARPRLRVAITGASGLVGRALSSFLTTGGHTVVPISRGKQWDPLENKFDASLLEGVDAVVHLAGENIAARRWDEVVKWELVESRVRGTALIADAAARLGVKTMISASATGLYGSRGDEVLTETSAPGKGFLADLCKRWEIATDRAKYAGVRVVNLRLGVILTSAGGALDKMLLPFRMGAGGRLGSGRQYMPWIGLDDAIYAIHHLLFVDGVAGPVLAVADSTTNVDFTKALGRALHRPTIFPIPAFAARLAFGEVADEALLSSQRCEAGRLRDAGFVFQHPTLVNVLKHTLGG
jgi:hypothetical protein